jgi:glycosyltransferase involved in cell wall biosynthesis
MSAFADSLHKYGYKVIYVANKKMSKGRSDLGWTAFKMVNTDLLIVSKKNEIKTIIKNAPVNSIHICEGIRANGLISYTLSVLKRKKLKYFIILEMIDLRGIVGLIRSLIYKIKLLVHLNERRNILLIGHELNVNKFYNFLNDIYFFPFAYFLKNPSTEHGIIDNYDNSMNRPFRFIFVGSLIKRKQIDKIIITLKNLEFKNVEFWIVGGGEDERYLRDLSDKIIPGQVIWLGVQKMENIPKFLVKCDCLILPSKYDGWGAVVSEALMVGTPVICSDSCGSSTIVKSSNFGGVFKSGDYNELKELMCQVVYVGLWNYEKRIMLVKWAKCIDNHAGAEYLNNIINYQLGQGRYPSLPWM